MLKSFGTTLHDLSLAVGVLLALSLLPPSLAYAVNDITIDGNVTSDWNDELCRPDDGGHNDVTGNTAQRDLTRVCFASNHATVQPADTLYTMWQWDEARFSGNNSGDGCANFDTNRDSLVDYALCVTVTGDPPTMTATSPTLYACLGNNLRTDRCNGPQAQPFSGACAIHPYIPLNPFGIESPNEDTGAECRIPLSDIGVTPGAIILVNVCAYPSQQPGSSPSDCTLSSTRLSANTQTGQNTVTSPTLILLVSLSATHEETSIVVGWETAAEYDTLGFHLYRSSDGSRESAVRVTDEMIWAGGDVLSGALYSWTDTNVDPDVVYSYWLQEIDLSGLIQEYGPVRNNLPPFIWPFSTCLPLIAN